MAVKLAVALSALYTAEAGPSFFVGLHQTITSPDLEHIYPIDVCVNTEIVLVGSTADEFLYSKFTCNDAGTELTETTYGSDSTCSDDNVNTTTTYTDNSMDQGAQWSFNCSGDTDYVQYYNFRADDTCCNFEVTTALPTTAVTGICYEYENAISDGRRLYSKFECGADGTFQRATYEDSDCTTLYEVEDESWTFDTSCAYWSTLLNIYPIYRTLDFCIEDGVEIAANDNADCLNVTFPETTIDESAASKVYPWAGVGLLIVSCLSWAH